MSRLFRAPQRSFRQRLLRLLLEPVADRRTEEEVPSGLKITMIILGVLVLIIASCYVFAARGRDSVPSVDPGQHGSVTIPQDESDV